MTENQKKTTTIEKPYEIWVDKHGAGFEWRVLKKYQKPELEAKNQYARWFCGVKSPYTYGEFELGDVYVSDIKSQATKIMEGADECADWVANH
jgi:hypothetical protein